MKLQCAKCKGLNIQVMAWVDANTNEYKSDHDGEYWCDDCLRTVRFQDITEEKYKQKLKQNNEKKLLKNSSTND